MTRWFDPALQNLVIGDSNTSFDGSETTLISQGGSVREIALSSVTVGTATNATTSTTQAVDTNTTAIATTAFVLGQAGSATPLVESGSGAVGTSTRYSRQDHVHPAASASGKRRSERWTGRTGPAGWERSSLRPAAAYFMPARAFTISWSMASRRTSPSRGCSMSRIT